MEVRTTLHLARWAPTLWTQVRSACRRLEPAKNLLEQTPLLLDVVIAQENLPRYAGELGRVGGRSYQTLKRLDDGPFRWLRDDVGAASGLGICGHGRIR